MVQPRGGRERKVELLPPSGLPPFWKSTKITLQTIAIINLKPVVRSRLSLPAVMQEYKLRLYGTAVNTLRCAAGPLLPAPRPRPAPITLPSHATQICRQGLNDELSEREGGREAGAAELGIASLICALNALGTIFPCDQMSTSGGVV